ncbi:serine hydrolase domain-containing protein [Agrilutibacter solisilvae]|uniref:Beta-lactamase family protein n=1 Tax=Agrilutibacter solisilvae TaxID=2763317 RepID=A0A974Y012_9GAMM|nr:serine hydrolase domain-containing protein [Lysobacter solisilvae]QSX77955.1 beta-lactamase family protein [Lysobacter solisilvae]
MTWNSAAIVACVLVGLSVPAPTRPAGRTPADEAAARLSDRMLAALVEATGVPGMGAAVVRDGVTVWTGSAGFRDVERGWPVDRHTRFRLASVSKVVTATAAARLMQEGALDVDAPVQSVLPWLGAQWSPLTTRQLAAHTSGLPHYQAVDEGRGAVHYASVRQAVGLFQDRQLLSVPGTAYSYSSWGYTLLSAVVEARAGVPFLDYVEDTLAPGLALGADATDGDDVQASRAYRFVDGAAVPAPPHDFSYTWGGGGLGATPEAIALFGARAMGGDIVSRATFEGMLTPMALADGSLARERDATVGFGWRVGEDADGARIAHHAGVTEGARSALVLWPQRRLAASVLSNALWVSSIEQTATMLAVPFQGEAPRPSPPARACPVRASAYTAHFDGKAFAGRAVFAMEDGTCIGTLRLAPGPLRDWVNGFPQRDADSLKLIGLDARGGLSRAAIVTPIGLHDLRAQPGLPGYLVRFGPERSLSLEFH